MPIFEYECNKCNRKNTILILKREEDEAVCGFCGSRDLSRVMSRFAMVKSDEQRLESLADPSMLSGLDEKDPSSIAKWMKKVGKEMGEDIDAGELDQLAEEAAGESEAALKGADSGVKDDVGV